MMVPLTLRDDVDIAAPPRRLVRLPLLTAESTEPAIDAGVGRSESSSPHSLKSDGSSSAQSPRFGAPGLSVGLGA